ncbi:MAG: ATPase domain-containing protein [Candidatus Micrarchaeota archaeon]
MASKKDGSPRIPTGIPGLDRMLEGGFVRKSSVLVRGSTGTAKTLFSLQFLYHGAIEEEEPGVYISFAESREATYNHGRKFRWELEKLAGKGLFTVIRYDPHEIVKIMEEGGGLVRDTIESLGAKRLAIDSLTAYEMFFESRYKANQSVLSLFELLKRWEVTSVVTSEFPVSPKKEASDRLGFLTDGIINLYHIRMKDSRMRALEIVKMRDTVHSEEVNRFVIEKDGVKVFRGLRKVDI